MREFTEEQWEEILNAAGKNRSKVSMVANAMAEVVYEPDVNVLVEGADAPVQEEFGDEAGE